METLQSGTMQLKRGSTRLWRVVCGVPPQTSSNQLLSPTVEKDGLTKSTARRRRWHARRVRSPFSTACMRSRRHQSALLDFRCGAPGKMAPTDIGGYVDLKINETFSRN